MVANTEIEWADDTFNPWIGCTKVSPACDNCYAERLNLRFSQGENWGAHALRKRTSGAYWRKPIMWNRQASASGRRRKVFCASLADVFDNKSPEGARADLWRLIKETPLLDWLLLTKRPQNIKKMLPDDWENGYSNVWLGTTVENQEEADRRVPALLSVPASVHFLSCEPLLAHVDLTRINFEDTVIIDALDGTAGVPVPHAKGVSKIDWVITGGESGPGFRPADTEWYRSLRDQCAAANVPFFFKQYEGATKRAIKELGRELDGQTHDAFPSPK